MPILEIQVTNSKENAPIYQSFDKGRFSFTFIETSTDKKQLIKNYFKNASIKDLLHEGYTLDISTLPKEDQEPMQRCFKEEYEQFIKTHQESWKTELTEFKQQQRDHFRFERNLQRGFGTFGVLALGSIAILAAAGLIFPPASIAVAVVCAIGAIIWGVRTFMEYQSTRATYINKIETINTRDKEIQAIITPTTQPVPKPLATKTLSIPIPPSAPPVATQNTPAAKDPSRKQDPSPFKIK